MSGSLGGLGTVLGGAAGFAIGGPAGAAVGAGIGGSIGGSIDAANAQEDALEAQKDIANTQLAFNQQQYNDWKEVFGPIEQNLSEYYQELDPETYASQIKNQLEAQFSRARKLVDRTMSQRGIDDSGLSVAVSKDMNQELARQKAMGDQQARDIVEQKKLGFLGLGLGNQNALLANINSSYSNMSAATSSALNMANQQYAAANQGLSNAIGATMYAYGRGMFNTPTTSSTGYNFNQWQLIK